MDPVHDFFMNPDHEKLFKSVGSGSATPVALEEREEKIIFLTKMLCTWISSIFSLTVPHI